MRVLPDFLSAQTACSRPLPERLTHELGFRAVGRLEGAKLVAGANLILLLSGSRVRLLAGQPRSDDPPGSENTGGGDEQQGGEKDEGYVLVCFRHERTPPGSAGWEGFWMFWQAIARRCAGSGGRSDGPNAQVPSQRDGSDGSDSGHVHSLWSLFQLVVTLTVPVYQPQ